jgi:hypothetical protein
MKRSLFGGINPMFAVAALLLVAYALGAPADTLSVMGMAGALLQANNLTLADWAKRLDPDGKVPKVAELLSQTNAILDDAVFVQGNLETGHRFTMRTGLPNVYYRAINQGVPTSKSTTVQVDEACGVLEARSHVDTLLLNLSGNPGEFRMSEDAAFIEAMNQTMASVMFYGNPGSDPRQFLGFQTRTSAIAGAGNAANILDAGGVVSTNCSIYLIGWGDNSVFCPFPKNSNAGLTHRDLGEESVNDANGNAFQAFRSLYQWQNGLAVKDWRYLVRICNIHVPDLTGQTGTQAGTAATQIINLMSRAIDRLPSLGNCRPVFYCNRTVASMLRVTALGKSSNALSIEQALTQFGKTIPETRFLGIPVRMVDQLLNTETRVV